MVEFVDVSKYSLKDINLKINKGEFCTLNGIGKTTFCKLASSCIFPDKGTIRIDGIVSNPKNTHFIKRRVAFLHDGQEVDDGVFIQNRTLAWNLTCFLKVMKKYDKSVGTRHVVSLLEKLGLVEKKDVLICHLSHTETIKAIIGYAVLKEPLLLLVDMPLFSLNQNTQTLIFDIIKTMNTFGTTVIFSGDIPYKTREVSLGHECHCEE